jgi:hypothetical protein
MRPAESIGLALSSFTRLEVMGTTAYRLLLSWAGINPAPDGDVGVDGSSTMLDLQ